MTERSEVPVDLLHWGLAIAPLVVLLILLAGRYWKAPQAAPVGLALVLAVAVLAFRTPANTLAVAGAKGVWDALFILLVVWPALLLYRVVDRAGRWKRCGAASPASAATTCSWCWPSAGCSLRSYRPLPDSGRPSRWWHRCWWRSASDPWRPWSSP